MRIEPNAPFCPVATQAERAAGFDHVPIANPPYRAVVLLIDEKKMAVKLADPRRSIGYIVVDRATMQQLGDCMSLGELQKRFPPIN